MNTKILVSLLVIGLTAIAIGGTMTGAFFTDTATSTENTFTTGTMHLQMSNDGSTYTDDVQHTITATGMYPTQTTTGKLCLKNAGTIKGIVTTTLSYTGTADFAKNLAVTEAYIEPDLVDNNAPYWAKQIVDDNWYNSSGTTVDDHYAAAVADGSIVEINNVYYPTIYGLQWITLHFWDNYTNKADQAFPADFYACETLKVLFYESGQDQTALEGQTLTATLTGNMKQAP